MADEADDSGAPSGADPRDYARSTTIAALDRLESLVGDARALPLSANVVVNRAEVLDLLDQARQALPDDVVSADAIVRDADAVLARADHAADDTVAEASARARASLQDAREKADTVLAEARDRAEQAVRTAKEQAERERQEAHQQAEEDLADAQARARELVADHQITRAAEKRGREVVAAAQAEAQKLREGANAYVQSVFRDVSKLLTDLQRRTSAGQRAIAERTGTDVTDIDIDAHA